MFIYHSIKLIKAFDFINIFICINILFFFISCGPFTDTQIETNYDLSPPVFEGLQIINGEKLELRFNEPTSTTKDSILIKPDITVFDVSQIENIINIHISTQKPGIKYSLTAIFEDKNRNSTNMIITFYGYNPEVPKLLINEFITNGSKYHPDLIEIKVLEGGNMGGVVVYQGTPSSWDDRIIFPVFPVKKDDYILVHFKPQGIAEEKDETESKEQSGGIDSSPYAYDFWVKDASGIGGNNGVLSIYENPAGNIIDGVLYSNRTSYSDDRYMGFGTKKVMERAFELHLNGGWKINAEVVQPEDSINPDGSTSTRSICRDSIPADTDSKGDWHIVPTRKSSFGKDNCDEVYSKN